MPPPNTPSGLAAAAVSPYQIDVSWMAFPGVTSYSIVRSGRLLTETRLFTVSGGASFLSDAGLEPSKNYFYRIQANNADGSSPQSEQVVATTKPLPPTPSDAVANRALSELQALATWAGAERLFVGKVGWPWGTDLAAWNAVGLQWYELADRLRIWAAAYASGRLQGTAPLGRYVADPSPGPLNVARPSTPVSEGHMDPPTGAPYRRGTNVVGAEAGQGAIAGGGVFSNVNPGAEGVDYAWPTADDWEYLAVRGVRFARLPFSWERLQPSLVGALDLGYLSALQGAVNGAKASGIGVVLALVGGARYWSGVDASTRTQLVMQVDGGALNAAHLADVWERLSAVFRDEPGVVAYDLMDEPRDLLPAEGEFSGTVLYTWNGTVQGWTGMSSETLAVVTTPVHEGSHALRVTKATTSSGAYFDLRIRTNSAQTPGSGTNLEVWAYLDPSTPTNGSWSILLWWLQKVTFALKLQDGSGTPLVAGGWQRVQATFNDRPIVEGDVEAFGMTISGFPTAAGTATVFLDEFTQGSRVGVMTDAEVWEEVTRRVVDSLRTAFNDPKMLLVPGYGRSDVRGWTSRHPAPWVVDPTNNIAYLARHFWDGDASGSYASSYAAERTAAEGAGFSVSPLPAPVGLTAGAVSSSQVDLAWTAVAGATGYRVLRATTAGGPGLLVGTPSTNSFTDSTVVENRTYHYKVSAVAPESAFSAEVSVLTPGYVPVEEFWGILPLSDPAVPLSIPGLVRWGMARDLGLAQGATVSSYPDASGAGHPLTSSSLPTYAVGVLKGRGVIRFDGVSQHLAANWTLFQPITRLLVFRYRDLVNTKDASDGGQALGALVQFRNVADGNSMVLYAGAVLEAGTPTTDWVIFAFVLNGASSKFWVNGGAPVASGDAGSIVPNGITLGSRGGGTIASPTDHAEDVTYDRILTLGEINALGAYLADVHGLTWATAT